MHACAHTHLPTSSYSFKVKHLPCSPKSPLTVSQHYYVGWPSWMMEDHLTNQ